jgi:hypothetical protein
MTEVIGTVLTMISALCYYLAVCGGAEIAGKARISARDLAVGRRTRLATGWRRHDQRRRRGHAIGTTPAHVMHVTAEQDGRRTSEQSRAPDLAAATLTISGWEGMTLPTGLASQFALMVAAHAGRQRCVPVAVRITPR